MQAPIDPSPVAGIAQPTLSAAALRDCLQKRQAMVEIAAQPPVDPAELRRERAAIDARQAALDDEHVAIADDDAKAVEAYNAKLSTLQSRINRFNDDVQANAEQAQLGEGLRQDFNAHCAGQVYYRDSIRSRNLADQP